jgi:transglutaminase-like putative cysteine protease
VFLTSDQQLIASEPVTRPITYDLVSYTHTVSTDSLSLVAERLDKRLPPDRNRRSVRLGQTMRAAVASDAEFVESVLTMFRRGGFEYTLTPPLLSLNSVDDFLFDTKLGFCGHYASAFVTLMRAGGVPARVVTGYQGGEWNSIRQYFLVRQSAAHAWAEVWMDGRGWTRVDPTAVVAPERLRRGIADMMPSSLSETSRFLREVPWLANMRLQWDAVNDWWTERVVRFDFNSQSELLKWFGFDSPTWETLGWLFAGALVAWLAVVAWQIGRSFRSTPMDRLARAYVKLCGKLTRAGAPREPHEGPMAYAATVASRRPDLAASVRALLDRYAELRYGRQATPDASPAIADFERAVSRLQVRRAPSSTP